MEIVIKMLIEEIIDPSEIESTLKKIWEDLGKKNKVRASLFNLIIFNRLSTRTDYFRKIVLNLIEKYPCRIIFITSDPSSKQTYLKTAVSIISPEDKDNPIACDNIDIGVSGENQRLIPFVILPHILPDLPVYLLWSEDLKNKNLLFERIKHFATRIIFDSEACDSLINFSKLLLEYHQESIDISDLNWARTEGWRELLAAIFRTQDRLNKLEKCETIEIVYNSLATQFFNQGQIKSIYLQAWLASSLEWKFVSLKEENNNEVHFTYIFQNRKIKILLKPKELPQLMTGSIASIKMITKDEDEYYFARDEKQSFQINIKISSPSECEIPYYINLEKTMTTRSLIKEIFYGNTSIHFLKTLKMIKNYSKEGYLC